MANGKMILYADRYGTAECWLDPPLEGVGIWCAGDIDAVAQFARMAQDAGYKGSMVEKEPEICDIVKAGFSARYPLRKGDRKIIERALSE